MSIPDPSGPGSKKDRKNLENDLVFSILFWPQEPLFRLSSEFTREKPL